MAAKDHIAGKTAVVTGISKGIGRALSISLLDRGARVIGWGLNPPAQSHPELHFIPCDVSDEHAVEAAAAATFRLAGSVDFLINNAGFGYFNPIESFDADKFRRMMDVNVTGAFLVTRAFVAGFKARKSGHIINISSIAGKVGMPHGEGYNASKFAITGFSECLFQELRKDGIKVTTVFPGSTATQFFDEIPGFEANDKMVDPRELAESIIHVLNTSPNYLIREIEIRPLNSR